MTTETRLEADSIGTMEVPAEAYYGVQALRAKQNFPITGTKLHPVFIRNLAQVKKAAAITNNNAGLLPKDKMDAIIKACDEVIAGKWAEEFIVDAIQGGAGTSANMNMNEVIANRAGEILGCPKGSYKLVHPNDHVNMAQSTKVYCIHFLMSFFDTFPVSGNHRSITMEHLAKTNRNRILKLCTSHSDHIVKLRCFL